MIGLRELECSERIIAVTTLIKESIDFWKEDVRPDDDQEASILSLNSELDKISDDIDLHAFFFIRTNSIRTSRLKNLENLRIS